jgi:hypothetical protein
VIGAPFAKRRIQCGPVLREVFEGTALLNAFAQALQTSIAEVLVYMLTFISVIGLVGIHVFLLPKNLTL